MGLSDHSVTAKVTEYDPKWGDRPTTDIVDRLRGHWRAAGQGCTSLCMQCAAADHIERLRAEVDIKGHRVDAAADEIERLRADLADQRDIQRVLLAEIEEQQAEIERRTLPPGDWRVSVDEDGKVDVVPLALAEMPWIRVDGRLAPIADRPLWFDAPEQGDE